MYLYVISYNTNTFVIFLTDVKTVFIEQINLAQFLVSS